MVEFVVIFFFVIVIANLLLGMSESAYHKKRLEEIANLALWELALSKNLFLFHHRLTQQLRHTDYFSDEEVLDVMRILEKEGDLCVEEHTLGRCYPYRYTLTPQGKKRVETQDL